MATVTTQSEFLKMLGPQAIAAAEKHKADPVTYSGFSELPPIDAGIARLVDCKFTKIAPGKKEAGKYMFYAAGVVVMPKEVNGIPVYGERTQISCPLYDTPTRTRKTTADHIEWVQNELKKLGASAGGLGAAQLEATTAALKKLQPFFKFRTWKGEKQLTGPYANKEPMLNHTWNGACEFSENGDETGGVEDSTAAPTTEEESISSEEPAAEEAPTDEFGDLDSLATAADSGNEKAMAELKSQALAAGASEEDVDGAENWAAVAAMISGAGDTSAEEPAPEEEEWKPAKGQVYLYKFLDPKTKKPAKKGSEAEILSVDEVAQTVTIKNLTTGKTHMDVKTKKPFHVKWTDLESAS